MPSQPAEHPDTTSSLRSLHCLVFPGTIAYLHGRSALGTRHGAVYAYVTYGCTTEHCAILQSCCWSPSACHNNFDLQRSAVRAGSDGHAGTWFSYLSMQYRFSGPSAVLRCREQGSRPGAVCVPNSLHFPGCAQRSSWTLQ